MVEQSTHDPKIEGLVPAKKVNSNNGLVSSQTWLFVYWGHPFYLPTLLMFVVIYGILSSIVRTFFIENDAEIQGSIHQPYS